MTGHAMYLPGSDEYEVRVTLERRDFVFSREQLNRRIRDLLAQRLADAVWARLSPHIDALLASIEAAGAKEAAR